LISIVCVPIDWYVLGGSLEYLEVEEYSGVVRPDKGVSVLSDDMSPVLVDPVYALLVCILTSLNGVEQLAGMSKFGVCKAEVKVNDITFRAPGYTLR
jgi:hypothetical protein